jgi:WD40 repeat protein
MSVDVTTPPSPYKGLAPFEDSDLDALFFFGRERESEVIAANLMAARITVLYGPSGVGKSSVLRAGVAHRLRQEQEAAVLVFSAWAGDPVAALIEAAAGTGDSLADALADAANLAGGDLYVILDQFEECFLYHNRGGAFASQLAQLFRRSGLRVNVLLGIREDSLARLDTLKASIPNLLTNRLRLERLDRAAGAAAIVGPIGQYNQLVDPGERVDIEPRLADAILDEVTAGRVELGVSGRGVASGTADEDRIEAPYLQLVLDRLWAVERARGSQTLRLSTLRELGGAAHIVEDHLERAMSELSPSEKEAAAAMYNFLVTPSGTKIAHGVRDLAGYAAVDETEASDVLRRLTDERIVRASSANGPASTRYEIFHDVLADAVLAWRTRHTAERALREAERRRRRARLVAAGALFGLVVVAGVAVFALLERDHARTEEQHARAGELAAQSNVQLGIDPRQSLALSLAAARLDDAPPVQAALRNALLATRVRRAVSLPSPVLANGPGGRFVLGDGRGRVYLGFRPVAHVPGGAVTSVALAGRQIAAGTQDGSITLLGTRRMTFHQPGPVSALALSTSAVAAGTPDGDVRLWRLSGREGFTRHVRGTVTSLAFSPGGTLLLVTSHDRRARLYDVASGRMVMSLGHGGFVNVAAFSPDGRLVATGGQDHNARIWDVRTHRLLHTLYGARGGLTAITFSPDGKLVATASSDAVGRVYSAATGLRLYFLIGHVNAVNDIAFSPDGRWLATASSDTTVRVWTSTIGQALGVLHGNSQIVTKVFFTRPDRLVTVGADSTVRVWDAGTAPDLRIVARQREPFVSAARRRNEIGVVDAAGIVHVLDPRGRHVVAERFGPRPRPPRSTRARSGSLVARASGDAIRMFRDGRVLQELRDLSTKPIMKAASIRAIKFSPDGKLIASVGDDHYLRVWDVKTGHKLYAVVAHQGPIPDFAFSPDSRWIATAGTISVRVWDARSPTQLLLLLGPTKPVQTVLFTADGDAIVAAGQDGTIRRYECVVCGTLPDLMRAGESRLRQTTP